MGDALFSADAGIGRITINRPSRSNSLNLETMKELRRILLQAGCDSGIRAIAFTGAGEKAFCAGLDLRAAAEAGSGIPELMRAEYKGLLLDIVRCPIPVVSLAQGHVMGGGIGITLASDICLACDDVRFSTPEINIGMFPMMVLALLYRNVGRKKATEMMFLGEPLTAAQAQEYGIVNHVYSRPQFDRSASEMLAKLAGKSSAILRIGKRAINKILDSQIEEQELFLESALAEVMSTGDSREGIKAFFEKRMPEWS